MGMIRAVLLACACVCVCVSAAERRAGDSFLKRLARSYSQSMDTPGLLPRDSHSTVHLTPQLAMPRPPPLP